MTITRLRIRNFQSLEDVDMPLGNITVVKGPSNVGKSAVVRALRLLAQNAQGNSYVRQGHRTATVEAWLELDGHVAINRGQGVSEYNIDGQLHTKCGAKTPELATKALALGDNNFAQQFDKPFLTDIASTQLATILGELTDIDLVFAAIKEANRTSLAAGKTVSTREAEIARYKEQLQDVPALAAEKTRLDKAQALLDEAVVNAEHLARIAENIKQIEVCETALTQVSAQIKPHEPLLALAMEIETRIVAISAINGACQTLDQATTRVQQAKLEATHASTEASDYDAEARIHTLLQEAGTCPTCLQPVH